MDQQRLENAAQGFTQDQQGNKYYFTSPYMQYAVKCLQPGKIPAVVHADGTSRVQTVNKKQHPGLYDVLSHWYSITGVPVLLNTSLNIKGQPLLNDENDILVSDVQVYETLLSNDYEFDYNGNIVN